MGVTRDFLQRESLHPPSMAECRRVIVEKVCRSFWVHVGEPNEASGCQSYFAETHPDPGGNPFVWPDPELEGSAKASALAASFIPRSESVRAWMIDLIWRDTRDRSHSRGTPDPFPVSLDCQMEDEQISCQCSELARCAVPMCFAKCIGVCTIASPTNIHVESSSLRRHCRGNAPVSADVVFYRIPSRSCEGSTSQP
ncbi:hypothetical protein LZK73_20495 [Neorhizobium galegae]|nr:hypothetical protein LZK73_20495 [Neorhizobium galegae]